RSGRGYPISSAVWDAGNGGEITFTTSAPHLLHVGDLINTVLSIPNGYNRQATRGVAITSVPTPTPPVIPRPAAHPGAITTKGYVDTLPNPGAIGNQHGSVNGLTTATLSTPTASPGTLTTPDVTITFTAPLSNTTITTYVAVVTTTATIVGVGDAATT